MLKLRISRRAVSSVIGGIIVLSLFLTALAAMVLVSQQYDSYQATVNQMSQLDVLRFSENLAAPYPGLLPPTIVTCGGVSCSQYILMINNFGIQAQIARIYINSTGGPCATLCIFDPAFTNKPTSYGLQANQRLINQGETNHEVSLWIPISAGQLPQASASNSIFYVTTRGRIFSLAYPFPPVGQAAAAVQANIATGTMKIAYTGLPPGFNSKNEPGAVAGGSGGTVSAGYCHQETGTTPPEVIPLPVQGLGGGSTNTLWFVNPWMTNQIFTSAFPGSGTNDTTVYIYVNMTNPQSSAVTLTAGSLLISVSSSTSNAKVFFIGGNMYGEVYNNQFYYANSISPPSILPNTQVFLIFRISAWNTPTGGGLGPNPGLPGVAFTGTASVTNGQNGNSYFSADLFLDGLYVRPSC